MSHSLDYRRDAFFFIPLLCITNYKMVILYFHFVQTSPARGRATSPIGEV